MENEASGREDGTAEVEAARKELTEDLGLVGSAKGSKQEERIKGRKRVGETIWWILRVGGGDVEQLLESETDAAV